MPDVNGLVNTAVLNTKIKEVEDKIPEVSGLIKTDKEADKKIPNCDVNTRFSTIATKDLKAEQDQIVKL